MSVDGKDLKTLVYANATDYVAPELESQSVKQTSAAKRPPIQFSSPSAFVVSVGERFKSIWTRRFLFSFLAGQIVCACILVILSTTSRWPLPLTPQPLFSSNMHYRYECHHYVSDRQQLGPSNNTKRILVSSLNVARSSTTECLSLDSYFTLFITYTPYTMYKCKRPPLLCHLHANDSTC